MFAVAIEDLAKSEGARRDRVPRPLLDPSLLGRPGPQGLALPAEALAAPRAVRVPHFNQPSADGRIPGRSLREVAVLPGVGVRFPASP